MATKQTTKSVTISFRLTQDEHAKIDDAMRVVALECAVLGIGVPSKSACCKQQVMLWAAAVLDGEMPWSSKEECDA